MIIDTHLFILFFFLFPFLFVSSLRVLRRLFGSAPRVSMAGDESFAPRSGGNSRHTLSSAPGKRAGNGSAQRSTLAAEKESVAGDRAPVIARRRGGGASRTRRKARGRRVGSGSPPPGSQPAHAPPLATGNGIGPSLDHRLLGGSGPRDRWPPVGMAAVLGSWIGEVSPARRRLSPLGEGEGEDEIQIRGLHPPPAAAMNPRRPARTLFREFRAAGENARRHDVHSSYAAAASCSWSGGSGPLYGSIAATCSRAATSSLPPLPPGQAAA
jgi:hypothetical protein